MSRLAGAFADLELFFAVDDAVPECSYEFAFLVEAIDTVVRAVRDEDGAGGRDRDAGW
jgi:hypothetical protein